LNRLSNTSTAVQAIPMSEGDAGVGQTVKYMRRLIDQGKKDPAVHERAAWILTTYKVPAFDFEGEFRAIFHWISKAIRWTRDPTGKEGLHSAAEILRLRIGDCDDFTILMCSMLGTVGHRTRLVTIANHADDPETFSHVYPEVQLNDKWIPMDGGRRNPAFAKGPRSVFRRHVWDVDTNEDYEDTGGLGGPGMTRRPARLGWATPYARPTGRGRVAQVIAGRRLGQLGQDDGSTWDWSQFETLLPSLATAVTTGTAKIVQATNAPQLATAQYSAALETAQLQQLNNPLGSLTANPTLLLLGVGLVAVLMFAHKGDE
jgi:hypothetical protein